jgi:hypothetical protein
MAEASPPTKTEALSNIDPRYLGEYVEFSGQLREYVKDTLSKAFRTDPNPVRRSHHIISLVQLEYAAYEDASAILKALISTRQGKTNTVLEVLESYKPGEAVLASSLTSHPPRPQRNCTQLFGWKRQSQPSGLPGFRVSISRSRYCSPVGSSCRIVAPIKRNSGWLPTTSRSTVRWS